MFSEPWGAALLVSMTFVTSTRKSIYNCEITLTLGTLTCAMVAKYRKVEQLLGK